MPRYQVTLDGRTFVVEGDRPPNEAEARQALQAHLSADKADAPKPPAAKASSAEPYDPNPITRIGHRILRMVKDDPVRTLSTAGAALAVPFTGGASLPAAIAAAGLGGAGGAGIGTMVDAAQGNAPEDGVVGTMAREGAIQAATEGGGGLVGKGLKLAGAQMYRGALRPSAAIRRKYPNVVEQGLEEGAIVGGREAKPAMFAKAKASKAAADDMVAGAQAAGAPPVTRRDVRQPLVSMAKESREASRLTGLPDDTRAIASRAQSLQPSYQLDEAHQAARILNDKADSAFKAARAGGQVAGIDANMNKALASAFSGAVKDRVPGLAAQNATTANRVGLAKALGDAAERPSVLANHLAMGAVGAGLGGVFGGGEGAASGLGAAAGLKALSSPRSLSVGGIVADRGGRMPLANLFRAALMAAMAAENQQ